MGLFIATRTCSRREGSLTRSAQIGRAVVAERLKSGPVCVCVCVITTLFCQCSGVTCVFGCMCILGVVVSTERKGVGEEDGAEAKEK